MDRSTTITVDGVAYEADPATIEQSFIGFEDHGIFTAYLSFAGEAWIQSETARAWTPAQLQSYIQAVIRTLGVQSWEEVASQEVLVLRSSPLGGIEGIAHRYEDRALVFSSLV